MTDAGRVSLLEVLAEARALGFLGPGDIEVHLEHAAAFGRAVEAVVGGAGPPSFLDPGSGGGVPGLALARRWPSARGVLLDARTRRCAALRGWCGDLCVDERVTVIEGRAEVLAHRPALREAFAVVVARSFGPPAVTAECATGFVAPGGLLVVSEPPDARERVARRWPAAPLAELALGPVELVEFDGATLARLHKVGHAGALVPRRTGVPEKRPRWS